MSLGVGALEVSGGPNANSREEVSMATLEAEPPKEPVPRCLENVNRVTWYLQSPKQIPQAPEKHSHNRAAYVTK